MLILLWTNDIKKMAFFSELKDLKSILCLYMQATVVQVIIVRDGLQQPPQQMVQQATCVQLVLTAHLGLQLLFLVKMVGWGILCSFVWWKV